MTPGRQTRCDAVLVPSRPRVQQTRDPSPVHNFRSIGGTWRYPILNVAPPAKSKATIEPMATASRLKIRTVTPFRRTRSSAKPPK
jgi:hypothetical protein